MSIVRLILGAAAGAACGLGAGIVLCLPLTVVLAFVNDAHRHIPNFWATAWTTSKVISFQWLPVVGGICGVIPALLAAQSAAEEERKRREAETAAKAAEHRERPSEPNSKQQETPPPPPKPPSHSVDHYAILGVSRSASQDDIKAAYRLRMKEYHPDKVAHLGPELRALAERKAKEINEAYETLHR